MSRISARKMLTDWLTPHLTGYKVIPSSRGMDVPDRPFVQISMRSFEPANDQASGFNKVSFIVTVGTPLTTPQRAEDDLDDHVADLLRALDAPGSSFAWEHAEKVSYGDRHLAYDVRVYGLSPKH